MANLYVSSTFSDLKEFREQVRNTLRRLGHLDVAMEYYNASDERPVDKCLRDVENVDLYLGIFAWRYGYVPEGYDKSITELEYRKAVESGKECLIFILHEEAPWPRTKMERGAASEKVEALRNELCGRHTVQFFSNEDELRAVVSEALNDWAKKQGLKQNILSTDWDAYARAVVDEHRWVRLVVIAGARQDRPVRIPLTEVFVPQMTAGPPTYEVPDEVLKHKRDLFTIEKAAESFEESESSVEIEDQETRESSDSVDVALPELSLDVLGRERTQVFLGGPGSGKSTLLLYSMLTLCDSDRLKTRPIANLTHIPIPFLVELRQYVLRQMPNFIAYIVANIQERYGTTVTPEDLHALLSQERRALMLFDGLDEVFNPSERQRVIQQFKVFARQYSLVQIVVTSRIVGYDKVELGVAEFQHYTLLDFNLPQIQEFVPCWYRYYTWQGDQRDAQGLIRRITESRRLMELAGNPLLLTMMGVIYKHQDLPEQRWKLYERCTEVLLEDWDIKSKSIDLKTFLPLDIQIRTSQKVEILQRVSLYMLENHQPGRELNAIAQQPLMRILAEYLKEKYNKSAGDAEATAEGILNHLRERTYILASVGEGIFGFVHRTFMEYFAAGACLANFNARKADYAWLNQELYGMHWQQDAWQEVLLLLTAMLAGQGSPIIEVIEHLRSSKQEPPYHLAFAARCLAESGEIPDQNQAQSLLITLAKKIAAYAKSTKGETFVEAGLAAFTMLAPLVGVSEEINKIIDGLNSATVLRKRMAAWQMGFALRSHAERLPFALTALGDSEEAVRRGAIAALEREWSGREEVGNALVDVVRKDTYMRVRQAAMEALRRAWPNQIELLDAIESRIKDETAYTFVEWTIRYLEKYWSENPRALKTILKLGTYKYYYYSYGDSLSPNENKNIRQFIAHAVSRSWRKQLSALCSYIIDSTELGAYITALEALVKGWDNLPESFNLLLNQAINARAAAIRVLAQTWGSKHEVISLLKDHASSSSGSEVQLVAIGGLLENQSKDPKILPLIYNIAITDSKPKTRIIVLELIAGFIPTSHMPSLMTDYKFFDDLGRRGNTSYQQEPLLLPLLYSRSAEDPNISVRIASLTLIYKIGIQRDGTLPFLIERCINDESVFVRAAILALLTEDKYFLKRRYNPNDYKLLAIVGLNRFFSNMIFDYPVMSHPNHQRRTSATSWLKAPIVLSLLHNRLAYDPEPGIRIMTIRIIRRYRLATEQTILLLKERIDIEPDLDIKHFMKQYLAQMQSNARST